VAVVVTEPQAAGTPYWPRHLLLQWHITERCNLRCAHCYQAGRPGAEMGFDGWLEIVRQFESFISTGPVRGHITVTGGEPLLHRDFPRLMERLTTGQVPPSLAILTNGTLIDRAVARQLRAWSPLFVQVSLDGDRVTHDAIRGAGAFDRAILGMTYLMGAGVPTFLAFTAHRGNYRQFPEIARIGRELGVRRVWADRLIPTGTGSSLSDLCLTPEETHEFVELLRAARAARSSRSLRAILTGTPRTEIALHRALQFTGNGSRPYHCTAGDTLITVMPNGDLYPCRRMPIRVGNLLERPLARLYDCDLFAALRDRTRVSIGCEQCVYAHLCGGGLRCLAYATTGDPFRADPGCWLANPDKSEMKGKNAEAVTDLKKAIELTSDPDLRMQAEQALSEPGVK